MDATLRASWSQRMLAWLKKEAAPLLMLLGLFFVARDTLANHYVVPSGSMQPALQPGDRVVVDMRAYGLRLPFSGLKLMGATVPQRGEVVVFASPADGVRMIKRVVAVAGDRVRLQDGRLSVNGRPLQTTYASGVERFGKRHAWLDLTHGGGPDIADVQVPSGKVLVLGDHRGNSLDGRFFGWVDADRIYGRAMAVYYRRGEGVVWQRL
ncbi:signal peptidase I [Stenotrophomonas sepilia]